MSDSIIVNITKKYWEKYHFTAEGILEVWDTKQQEFVHLRVHLKPTLPFKYAIVNVTGSLRGYFEKIDIKYLKRDYNEQLIDDLGEGWYVVCSGPSWKRFMKEEKREIKRGFKYALLSDFIQTLS